MMPTLRFTKTKRHEFFFVSSFVRLLAYTSLRSYAYAYDDSYVAGLTPFLCFAFCFLLILMLLLTCEPGLRTTRHYKLPFLRSLTDRTDNFTKMKIRQCSHYWINLIPVFIIAFSKCGSWVCLPKSGSLTSYKRTKNVFRLIICMGSIR